MRRKPLKRQTARRLFSGGQVIFLLLLTACIAYGFWQDTLLTLQLIIGGLTLFYCVFVGLKVVTHLAAWNHAPPQLTLPELDDPTLPSYTILVPLHNEANMLPRLVEAIDRLRYPKEKQEVLLLLESDDFSTINAARHMEMPPQFKVVVVAQGGPKTKPKACNVGFGIASAEGERLVIFDAEDRPDPDQLLKAEAAFRNTTDDVVCVQARLFFWNGRSAIVSRFYWAEYVIHFEWMLRGLDRIGLVPPLGGTSNHFKTEALRKVAIDPGELGGSPPGIGAWDPFNVTEDAELAGALTMHGYRIEVFDSVTGEEAPVRLRVADKQRRRWLKGFAQTGLVYTRRPLRRIRAMGFWRFCAYNLFMLGTPLSLMLNPIFWGLTIAYFATRNEYIESLFPTPVFYTGIAVMLFGNVLLFLQLVVACLHRGNYESVKYMFLVPLWWTFTSWSAWMMCFELLSKKTRYKWHKTTHGHDLAREVELFPEGQDMVTEPVPLRPTASEAHV